MHVGTSGGQRIDDTKTLLNDIFPRPTKYDVDDNVEDDIGDKSEDDNEVEAEDVGGVASVENIDDMHSSAEIKRIMELLEDSEKDLYEGCTEYSRFSFMLKLLHIKTLSGMSDNYFEMLLDLLRTVIPGGENSIPPNNLSS